MKAGGSIRVAWHWGGRQTRLSQVCRLLWVSKRGSQTHWALISQCTVLMETRFFRA